VHGSVLRIELMTCNKFLQNSWNSASPHICMWLCATLVTYLADKLIQRKTCSVVFMRKVCNSIAQWGTAIALIAVAYSGCNRLMAVIFLNMSVGLIGASFGGFLVNSIDIAPNHAGVIMVMSVMAFQLYMHWQCIDFLDIL